MFRVAGYVTGYVTGFVTGSDSKSPIKSRVVTLLRVNTPVRGYACLVPHFVVHFVLNLVEHFRFRRAANGF